MRVSGEFEAVDGGMPVPVRPAFDVFRRQRRVAVAGGRLSPPGPACATSSRPGWRETEALGVWLLMAGCVHWEADARTVRDRWRAVRHRRSFRRDQRSRSVVSRSSSNAPTWTRPCRRLSQPSKRPNGQDRGRKVFNDVIRSRRRSVKRRRGPGCRRACLAVGSEPIIQLCR